MTDKKVAESDAEHESDSEMRDVAHTANIDSNNKTNEENKSETETESESESDGDVDAVEMEPPKRPWNFGLNLVGAFWPEDIPEVVAKMPDHVKINHPVTPTSMMIIDQPCNWPGYVFYSFPVVLYIDKTTNFILHTSDRAQVITVKAVGDPILDMMRSNEWPMHYVSSDVDQLDVAKWAKEVSPYWLERWTLHRTEVVNLFEGYWKAYSTSIVNKAVIAEFNKLEALYPHERKDKKLIKEWKKEGFYAWAAEPCLIHQCQLNRAENGALVFDVPQRRIGGRCRVWGDNSSSSNDNSHNHNKK